MNNFVDMWGSSPSPLFKGYAVQETANYIALVRRNYPDILIGDIEPYPFIQREDLIKWIDVLQAKLSEMNVLSTGNLYTEVIHRMP